MRRSDGLFVWIGKQDSVLRWSWNVVAAHATPHLSSWDSSWPGRLSQFVRITRNVPFFFDVLKKSVISFLRCHVCQPRAEKEKDSEGAFTASARPVQTRPSYLITGTYPRWAVHRRGGRQKAWRLCRCPFGTSGSTRGTGTMVAVQ